MAHNEFDYLNKLKRHEIFFIVFAIVFAFSCNTKSKFEIKNDSKDSIVAIDIDSSLRRSVGRDVLESMLYYYVDSINNSTSVATLPQFLNDPNFDNENMSLTFNTSEDGQFRSYIINRATNCKALNLIINEKSGIYRIRPSKELFNSDYSDSTNFQLALARYALLECK